eukprot:g31691.t1
MAKIDLDALTLSQGACPTFIQYSPSWVQAPSKFMMFLCLPIIFIISISEIREMCKTGATARCINNDGQMLARAPQCTNVTAFQRWAKLTSAKAAMEGHKALLEMSQALKGQASLPSVTKQGTVSTSELSVFTHPQHVTGSRS